MRSYITLALSAFLTLSLTACSRQTPLQKAAALLNAENVKSVQVVASGKNFSVGQNYTATDPWSEVTVKNYTALINYDTNSARVELTREMGAVMPKGGDGQQRHDDAKRHEH